MRGEGAHFPECLRASFVEDAAGRFGFRNLLNMEKLYLDFESLYHVREEIPGCVVKGGMAVPFHIPDPAARRLSVDMDVVTSEPRESVMRSMDRVRERTRGFLSIRDPHKPRNPQKVLPLLTYYCKYESHFGANEDIKIDIFYGDDGQARTSRISPGFDLFGLKLDFPVDVYERGPLMGDKITTLAFNTVGIPADRRVDVTKHVYDVSSLARQPLDGSVIGDAVNTFRRTAEREIGYGGPMFSLGEIADDVSAFSDELLDVGERLSLKPLYAGRLHNFAHQMLGSGGYADRAYVSDILLVRMLALLAGRCMRGMGEGEAAQRLRRAVERLGAIGGMGDREKAALTRGIARGRGLKSEAGSLIRNMIAEHAYLHDEALRLREG